MSWIQWPFPAIIINEFIGWRNSPSQIVYLISMIHSLNILSRSTRTVLAVAIVLLLSVSLLSAISLAGTCSEKKGCIHCHMPGPHHEASAKPNTAGHHCSPWAQDVSCDVSANPIPEFANRIALNETSDNSGWAGLHAMANAATSVDSSGADYRFIINTHAAYLALPLYLLNLSLTC